MEYAQQQAAETATVLDEAQALEGLLARAFAASNGGAQPSADGAPPDSSTTARATAPTNGEAASAPAAVTVAVAPGVDQLRARMLELRKRLLAMASEADNFAAQQKADLARSKRSLSQVSAFRHDTLILTPKPCFATLPSSARSRSGTCRKQVCDEVQLLQRAASSLERSSASPHRLNCPIPRMTMWR